MELRQYATLILKWWWLLVLGLVVAGAASYYVSKAQAPVYRASALILVDQSLDTRGPSYNDIMTSERLTRTYGELIRTTPVLEGAIKKVGLPYEPEQLEKLLQTRVIRDTQLLELSVDNEDPALARDIANGLAEVFIAQRHEEQLGQTSASWAILRQQIADLERQLRETSLTLEAVRSSRNPDNAEIARLQSVLSQAQNTYSQLIRSESDLRLAASRTLNGIKLAEPARLPQSPIAPKVLQNTLLAALVGLLLALGAAFLIEYLDDTVKSGSDLETAAKTALLAAVGRIPGSKDGAREPRVLAESGSRSSLGESYRILRANVDFAWAGQPGQVIMFTSANPREGKSTTLSNLATVFARDGRRVVMVDADLRRPSLHRAFDLEGSRGLTNLLADPGAQVADYLVQTKQPNLWLLPSGPIPPNPSELLGSGRMASLLQELRKRAEIVLIDTPPLLAVADPALVAARVDGVILVVEAGGTRMQALARANEVLERTSARVMGGVLNKLTRRSSEYYYRYYHRYYAAEPESPNGKGKESSAVGGRRTGGGDQR